MKKLVVLIVSCLPAMAAITGTVINGTTGQPQPGAVVSVLKMTPSGPQPGAEAKADPQGKFTLNEDVQGPTLVQSHMDGVTYTHVLTPGAPADNVTLEIYQASRQKGGAKVSKHMYFFQPINGELVVNETFLYANQGKTAWNDPNEGTLHFFQPSGATKLQVEATPPGGMPLKESPEKIGRGDTYKVSFPVRPGETRFDLSYSVPYKTGDTYSGKVITDDDNTYLIVPDGVTMAGDHLKDLGVEPKTKAHIYGLEGTSYDIKLTGTPAPDQTDASADSGAQDGAPQIQEIMPRLYTKVKLILGLALGILALGFVLLYRSPAGPETAKESNERGHR